MINLRAKNQFDEKYNPCLKYYLTFQITFSLNYIFRWCSRVCMGLPIDLSFLGNVKLKLILYLQFLSILSIMVTEFEVRTRIGLSLNLYRQILLICSCWHMWHIYFVVNLFFYVSGLFLQIKLLVERNKSYTHTYGHRM